MTWQVEVLKNTIKISEQCAEDIWNYINWNRIFIWKSKEQIITKGLLSFNTDLDDYKDYLYDYREIIKILKDNKSEGYVWFGSLDVPKGCFWGYSFDGNGGCKKLKGTINFVESESI
jgi:hypothetical protein